MSKVTSKLQITVPKVIAEKYGIAPGREIEWIAAGDSIRIAVCGSSRVGSVTQEERMHSFDQASERQRERDARARDAAAPTDRGWTREELYDRGRAG